MWREMAMFIKSHMKIQRLSLNICGAVPLNQVYRGSGNYVLQTAWHLEIDELLVLPPVEQLSIRWTTNYFPIDACNKHGAWCFAKRKWPPCLLASESLCITSFIKYFRDRLMASGQQLGLSQIRGGLAFSQKDQQYDGVYVVMEAGGRCNDDSQLAAHQVSHLANNNTGPQNLTSPRWPDDLTCMEVVSDDFHEALRHSRYLVRPPRKEVTFHFVWIDCLNASCANSAVDCEDFWGNPLIRGKLGLKIAAPHFVTNTVKMGYEADPRNFDNYREWRDRLRHLLQLPMWALDFVEILVLPRAIDRSELVPSLFNTPHQQEQQLGGKKRIMRVPDTPHPDLMRAVSYGEAEQTIFFTCEPAWPLLVSSGDVPPLWETDLHKDTVACLDRETGLFLEY